MSSVLTDLRLVVGLVGGTTAALLVPGVPWPVAWAFGIPFLLVVPGYAVVAALFPERPDGGGSPDWAARTGLSLVGSVLIVAGAALVLTTQGFVPFAVGPVVLLVGAVALLGAGVAAIRRASVPVDRRADPVAGGSLAGAFGVTGAQSVVLGLSVLVLASALAFAATVPADDPYSEVYLAGGEDVDVGPENGTLVTGEQNTVRIGLANHEGDPADYRVVVRLQRVAANGSVLDQAVLDGFTVAVADGETTVTERRLEPDMAGERLRLQVLVYRGGQEGAAPADLSLRRWVTVLEEGAA